MRKMIDRTGKTYGRLTVLSHAGTSHGRHSRWLCVCTCGAEKTVLGYKLSNGNTRSCGCLRDDLSRSRKPHNLKVDREIVGLKSIYSKMRYRNIKKGFSEIMDFETFCDIVKSGCSYCGIKNSNRLQEMRSVSPEKERISDFVLEINGIDRIDSSAGYTKENSVPCCKHCNRAKSDMPLDEFHDWIKRVYEFNFK